MAQATKQQTRSEQQPVQMDRFGDSPTDSAAVLVSEDQQPVVAGRIARTGEGGTERPQTQAELTRRSIAQMLRDAGLDPNRASIEAVAHPENNSTLYRLAYSTLAEDEVRFSEWDTDIVTSAKQFIAAYASSLQRDRNSIAGPLV